MKEVIFKRAEAKNFLSIGEEGIDLTYKKGLNVITGTNLDKNDSNGTGKSSVVEIVYFALFGSTLRDLSNDEVVNFYSKGSCVTNVFFDVKEGGKTKEYFVSRQLKPSKITIEEDGVDITKSTIPVNNNFIKSLISSGPEMFQNSVIMSVNSSIPFMQQKKVDKRKFIEDIMGLQVFGEMMSVARKKFNEIKNEHSLQQTKYETSLGGYKNIEELFQKYVESKDESEKTFKKRIKDCEEKIKTLKEESDSLQKEIDGGEQVETPKEIEDKIKKLKDLHTKIIKESSKLSYEKDSLIKDLKKSKEAPDHCPTCSRKFTKDLLEANEKRIEEINKNISTLEEDILEKKSKEVKINKGLDTLSDEREKYTSQIREIELKKQKISYNNQSKKSLDDDIVQFQKEIDKIDVMVGEYEEKLKENKKDLDIQEEEVKNSKKQLEIYKSIKFIVSEEGIRAYVVKKILDVLNSKLEYYLKKMNANCSCEFDNNFSETLINDKNKKCSYFNFSAGERKRIDLAVLFTFQDIRRLQGNVFLNLSIYDELLDSSLDKSGITCVLEILENKVEKNNEAVYIVTHRPDAIEDISGDVILLEKENGITRFAK